MRWIGAGLHLERSRQVAAGVPAVRCAHCELRARWVPLCHEVIQAVPQAIPIRKTPIQCVTSNSRPAPSSWRPRSPCLRFPKGPRQDQLARQARPQMQRSVATAIVNLTGAGLACWVWQVWSVFAGSLRHLGTARCARRRNARRGRRQSTGSPASPSTCSLPRSRKPVTTLV